MSEQIAARKDLIYFGYCVNDEIVQDLSGSSVAGNNMQLNVLKQFYKSEKFNLHCFTVYPVATFPRDPIFYYPKMLISLFDGLDSLRVSFINIPIIKQISQILSLYLNASKLLLRCPNAIILTYNMFPQVGLPAYWLKKKYPGCTLVTLLVDLPIDESPKRGLLSKLLRKFYYKLTHNAIMKSDKLIVISERLAKTYAPSLPYHVMEGGVNAEDATADFVSVSNREKLIIYSGRLVEYNGIIELIESMSLITFGDVKLHIYGDGPLREKVISLQTDRAIYMGQVDNNTMKRIQRCAYLLVNPRPIDSPFSQVVITTKLLEYLISGSPILTTKLSGFTQDYFDIMFFADSNAPLELAKKIDEIMAMPFEILDKMALSARDFVIEKKSWEQQMEKTIRFILNQT